MTIKNYFNQFFLKDFYQVCILFSVGITSLIVAYFFDYNVQNIFIFISSLLILFALLLYMFKRNTLFFAIYTWFFFFIFFPKKPIVYGLNSVLTHLVDLSYSVSILPSFSFYDIVNFLILIALFFKVFFTNNLASIEEKNIFKVFFIPLVSGLLMTVYYNFFLADKFGYNSIDQFHYLLKFFEGLVISVGILKCFNNKIQINLVLNLFLLGLIITSTEFLLAKFTSFLPDVVQYFVLDYRGGFRSIIHSGSLFSGMILYYGLISALHKKDFYLIFALLAFIPAFFTYERSIMLIFVISILFFLIQFFKTKHFVTHLLTISLFLLLLFPAFNSLSQKFFSSAENLNNNEDTGGTIKQDGWFVFSSSDARSATHKRGFDVFYAYPLLGAGPGNVKLMMKNSSIPSKANTFNMSDNEKQSYYDIVSGYHPTDPHHFYIKIIAEYGIIGIIFLISFLSFLFSNSLLKTGMNSKYLIPNSGIISILIYGFFQPYPISFPFLIFLIKWIDLIE